ncbi:MAG: hypothetical protein LBB67_05115 [Oscillospiraceae bacterium]|nr:hypothetical protein [Oscillospiraceae bacterium]
MKNLNEFSADVYDRAAIKKAAIQRRNRRIVSVVPVLAVVLVAAIVAPMIRNGAWRAIPFLNTKQMVPSAVLEAMPNELRREASNEYQLLLFTNDIDVSVLSGTNIRQLAEECQNISDTDTDAVGEVSIIPDFAKTQTVQSVEELLDYLTSNVDENDVHDVENVVAEYDEIYFEENALRVSLINLIATLPDESTTVEAETESLASTEATEYESLPEWTEPDTVLATDDSHAETSGDEAEIPFPTVTASQSSTQQSYDVMGLMIVPVSKTGIH